MDKKVADILFKKLKEVAIASKKNWSTMDKNEYYYVWKDFTSRMDAKQPEMEKIMREINDKQKKEVIKPLTPITNPINNKNITVKTVQKIKGKGK